MFSAFGPVVFTLVLDLPKWLIICAIVQLLIGALLLACWWSQTKAKMMWFCLVFAALVSISNWCACAYLVLSVAK